VTRLHRCFAVATALFTLSAGWADEVPRIEADEAPRIEADGTVHVPAFDLPETSYFSVESRAAMKRFREVYGPEFGTFSAGCANLNEVADDAAAVRKARQAACPRLSTATASGSSCANRRALAAAYASIEPW